GVVVSVRTRAGSTSESLAQETSAVTTTESAETRIIDFFMAASVLDIARPFNRTTPGAVKACNHFLMREMRTQDSVKNYMSDKIDSAELLRTRRPLERKVRPGHFLLFERLRGLAWTCSKPATPTPALSRGAACA